MMRDKFPFNITKMVLLALLFVAVLVLLGAWTRYIVVDAKENELRDALELVLEERGEKGLLELAGVPEGHINYGDNDLYIGSRGAWTYTDAEREDIAIYDTAAPSVVQIISHATLSDEGQGSGVILTHDGYIVTNKHVVGEGSQFSVNFYDGTTENAVLVGFDELTDIAVLKCERTGLTPMKFSTHAPVTGEHVISIGNPFGFTWSMTKGRVSGVDRVVFTADNGVIPNMIQTDALINPGNSGGPLIDMRGEMIGIVSSIYTTSGSAQGISFALPTETMLQVTGELIKNGKVMRGWLDVLSVELNPQIVAYSKLPVSEGLLVSQTVPGGESDRAGLKGGKEKAQYGQSVIYLGGDVILEIDGVRIRNYADYFSVLFGTTAGDTVDILIQRGDKRMLLKDVVLVAQDEENVRWILR